MDKSLLLKTLHTSETGPRDSQAETKLNASSLRIIFHGARGTMQAPKEEGKQQSNYNTFEPH